MKTLPPLLQGRDVLANLLVALFYALLGKWSLLLALPPGYATAIFPSAGLALGICVSTRLRCLPGVMLGSFLLNAQGFLQPHANLSQEFAVAIIVSTASTLQAWIGTRYMRRWTHEAMDSGRDILHFLFGIPLVCCVSSTLIVLGLTLLGKMAFEQSQMNWLAWWSGDLVGIVLVAPVVWIFFAAPRALWWQRRYLLGMPLLVGTCLSILIYSKTSTWETQQQMRSFHLRAQQISDVLQARLAEHEHFLQIAAVIFDDDDHALSYSDFSNVTDPHLQRHK
ncbi:MAG: MASE1 domain-containing protein, partial [Burkholderiales bacterium]|nr:MASE1 domain-containing protein [Burkholderiales bacterium]